MRFWKIMDSNIFENLVDASLDWKLAGHCLSLNERVSKCFDRVILLHFYFDPQKIKINLYFTIKGSGLDRMMSVFGTRIVMFPKPFPLVYLSQFDKGSRLLRVARAHVEVPLMRLFQQEPHIAVNKRSISRKNSFLNRSLLKKFASEKTYVVRSRPCVLHGSLGRQWKKSSGKPPRLWDGNGCWNQPATGPKPTDGPQSAEMPIIQTFHLECI